MLDKSLYQKQALFGNPPFISNIGRLYFFVMFIHVSDNVNYLCFIP